MKRKTAINGLVDSLQDYSKIALQNKSLDSPTVAIVLAEAIQMAKDSFEKEKEQIMEAYDKGMYSSLQYNKSPRQYYNETYKQD